MKYRVPEMEILFFETHDIVTLSTGETNYDENGNVIGGGTGSETAPDDGIF